MATPHRSGGRWNWALYGGLLALTAASATAGERQITTDAAHNHELDNNDNFSPDDRFLVFDTRTADGGIAASTRVAKVEIATGKITTLYQAPNPNAFGPGAGAATFNHVRNEVIFIHGPFNPTSAKNQYEKYRRIGMIVAADGTGRSRFADARNTQPPYTVGALRGGTHRHEFTGDGEWIGFTYNDAVMLAYGQSIGKNLDLRTIGVTRLGSPVSVPRQGQFSKNADGFSVLVVVVVPDPQPGSDDISHAAHDSWVGRKGYSQPDGHRQLARAFIGTVRDKAGDPCDELFIVDIPDDITHPGPLGPLQGTDRAFPMPPAGTVQRRLTHTADGPSPGCKGIVRASHDGERIAFQMRDDSGQWQIYLIAPHGDRPRQATFIKGGVTSGVRWHPGGHSFVCLAGSKIVLTVVKPGPLFGKSLTLVDREPAPFALVVSHDGKTIAYNRIVETAGKPVTQIFVVDFPDQNSDGIPDALR